MDLREVTSTYRFDLSLIPTHGFRRDPQGALTFVAADDPYVDVPLSALPLESVTTTYSLCPVICVLGPILLALFTSYKIRRYLAAYRSLVLLAMLCVLIFGGVPGLHDALQPTAPTSGAHILSGQWYLTHLAPPSMADAVFLRRLLGLGLCGRRSSTSPIG